MLGGKHEANIRGGEKTVHVFFKYLSRNLLKKEGGRIVPPAPSTNTTKSRKGFRSDAQLMSREKNVGEFNGGM